MLDAIKLWRFFSLRRRRQFWIVLILMLAVSISEIIGIGAVIPFLGALTIPEKIFDNPTFLPLINILELSEPSQIVLPITILFLTAIIVSAILRLLLLYVITRLSYAAGADLSVDIYKRTLYQDYETHLSRNSSEIINGIVYKTNAVISGVLNPTLTLISQSIILLSIVIILCLINFTVALSVSIGFGILYWIIIGYTKAQLKRNSVAVADKSTQMIKSLQEGLGGIRDVIIGNCQKFYCRLYRDADIPLRRALGDNVFISGSPRYLMEAIGMIIIVFIAYLLTQNEGGMIGALPTLGAIALGGQKLLPASQQVYSTYSTIKGTKKSLDDVVMLLEQPLPKNINTISPLSVAFNNGIKLENLSFRYTPDSAWVLKNINLSIAKGSRIGIMGETGGGKSTLIDIIMGLIRPSNGKLLIDDELINFENSRAWQSHIAHVPQNIYLSDTSISENIAFGVPRDEVNIKQVEEAAKKAKLDDLIGSWKDGYEAIIGERGVKLSGGQRQRIGIARALYKQADLLVFDEATNALDSNTEREVMSAINNLNKDLTILIIAHRLTTLKQCDLIISIGSGGELNVGSYKEMVGAEYK